MITPLPGASKPGSRKRGPLQPQVVSRRPRRKTFLSSEGGTENSSLQQDFSAGCVVIIDGSNKTTDDRATARQYENFQLYRRYRSYGPFSIRPQSTATVRSGDTSSPCAQNDIFGAFVQRPRSQGVREQNVDGPWDPGSVGSCSELLDVTLAPGRLDPHRPARPPRLIISGTPQPEIGGGWR